RRRHPLERRRARHRLADQRPAAVGQGRQDATAGRRDAGAVAGLRTMRILLLGANGQLGRTFLDQGGLAARGELVAASRDGALTQGGQGEIADLSIPTLLPALLDRVQPDVIVNAAAYTAVDR